jgi:collagenase-like PrtC family protease
MVDTVTLRTAVETAWSIFCATHEGVEVAYSRRCLLERHLQGRCEAREEEVDELASFGLAYLARLPEDEC